MVNTAKKRGIRESRTIPWTSAFAQDDREGPTVDPSRFRGLDDAHPGHWKGFPQAWHWPESATLAAEVRGRIAEALGELPARQRAVITLRDVEGYTSLEVCEMLEISAANQRVLLHRARAWVRGRIEEYFATVTEDAGGSAP